MDVFGEEEGKEEEGLDEHPGSRDCGLARI